MTSTMEKPEAPKFGKLAFIFGYKGPAGAFVNGRVVKILAVAKTDPPFPQGEVYFLCKDVFDDSLMHLKESRLGIIDRFDQYVISRYSDLPGTNDPNHRIESK